MTRERFAVSAHGLRQLHADREPWTLVKELIQNAWDEAPEASECDVRIAAGPGDTTIVTVEDDGPGFTDISHAWTLMAETAKRADPTKRGRFNLGEKEIIAVALCAEIETTGTTVSFPREGGRVTAPNTRKGGTRVSVTMPWNEEQALVLRIRLRRFRPTDCRLWVDGVEIPRRTPLASRGATLRTLILRGPGLPISETKRKTTIDVLERCDSHTGWIYEMGIPIQATTLPYDVDVQQKVPMPPNRNTVSASYLQDVMTETLNAMHEEMPGEWFSENWVRTAIEDDRIEESAVRTARKHRYSERAVLWSSDTDANMRAAEAGYQVIHPKAMSRKERQVMTTKGGLASAKDDFGRPAEKQQRPDTTNHVRRGFANWIRKIGRIVGLQASVHYVAAPEARFAARCTAGERKPKVTINTSFCTDEWLAQRGPQQLELIIHELAHALANTPMNHGPRWGDACAAAGAKVADAIARNRLVYDPGRRPTPSGWSISRPAVGETQPATS